MHCRLRRPVRNTAKGELISTSTTSLKAAHQLLAESATISDFFLNASYD